MKQVKVLCNIYEHGVHYGKKGDTLTVPDHIAEAHSKGKKPHLKIVSKEDKSASSAVKS